MGLSPSPVPLSRGLEPSPPLRMFLQTTIRTAKLPNSQVGLLPRVIPPDLGSRSKAPSSIVGSLTMPELLRKTSWPHASRVFNHHWLRHASTRDRVWADRAPKRMGVTPRQTCSRPNGFGCNLHLKT
ncbi:hypothetical protein BUALT_Bualt06G0021300 [Buddleja alternifolia]|uniref:Uncharacterized protein n=1 Tax=Buddleja alternifolia TaxID=168488 RepID=A0AAV6XGJ2_9LAMI|nr:hypothetical protein BUALT_Bualt06G0021300 [Buddleja alternifolia]